MVVFIEIWYWPDMAMFGKALSNGYAIAAVIGRESVMEAAQSTFISSTFWMRELVLLRV